MKTEFDFDKIGKREPYSVPDGFYGSLESRIKASANVPRKGRRIWRRAVIGTSTAAAAAIGLIILSTPQKDDAAIAQCSIEAVEIRFADLQADDREFLLETYEEDIFLTQTTTEE